MQPPTLPAKPWRVLLLAPALLATVGPPPATAQVPTHFLEHPDRTFPTEFSQIRGLRKSPGGRVLISDWIEERVVILDFAAGEAVDRGRVGAGPEEYRLPAALWPYAADSTLLQDMGNSRLQVLDPDGRVRRTIRAERSGRGHPRGIDARGGIYHAIPPWANPDASRDDSLAVVRWDPETSASEPIANVRGAQRRSPGVRLTPGIPIRMFSDQDWYHALPDGGMVVLRAGEYRLDHIALDGTTRRGPSNAYGRLPVTDDDKYRFVEHFLQSTPVSGRGPGGALGQGDPATDREILQMVRTNEFADVHPYFDAGDVHLAGDGTVWARRSGHADRPALYDVFDGEGVIRRRIELRPSRQVVGVGDTWIYVVFTGDFGLQTLERYQRAGP